ncbi:MAG: flavin reductase family protein [Flavitalea sp.]
MTYYPTSQSIPQTTHLLQHLIGPRPICFVSTIDKKGYVNLSPFSFFNLFSLNPPIVIFSPSRRVRDNTVKHTLLNVLEVPEAVINMVTYDMVQQVSLASSEYEKEVDEFIKSGFTKENATHVKPPMVKESKARFECKVLEVKSLGESGGAGQLVICEVICVHINDELLDKDRKLNQQAIALVGRLGGDWYTHVSPTSLFKVAKPNAKNGIGFDALPESIRYSKILTGNHLAQLANVHELSIVENDGHKNPADEIEKIHQRAKELLEEGHVMQAWQLLLK